MKSNTYIIEHATNAKYCCGQLLAAATKKKKKKKEHKGQMTIYRKSIVCFWRIINNPKCIKEKGVVWIIEIEKNIKKIPSTMEI